MTQHPGSHFFQIPGPIPVLDRVLRAMDMPVIDHRIAEFAARQDPAGMEKDGRRDERAGLNKLMFSCLPITTARFAATCCCGLRPS